MKKTLLTSAAFLGLTAGAMAADLPMRAAPPAFAPVPVAFSWTGFYVGVNAGYGFGSNNRGAFAFNDPGLRVPALGGGTVALTPVGGGYFGQNVGPFGGGRRDGFLGGVQAGYNVQFTPGTGFVLGVEADIQWADLGRRRGFRGDAFGPYGTAVAPVGTTAAAPFPAGVGVAPTVGGGLGNVAFFNNNAITDNNGRNNWFGTARLRAGYAFDRLLVYATGGIAFTDSRRGGVFVSNGFAGGGAVPGPFYTGGAAALAGAGVNPTGGGVFGRRNSDNFGWALGGGVEYAFTNNLSVKIEGLWVNFGNRGGFASGCCTAGQVVGVTNTGAAVTATNTTAFNRRDRADVGIIRAGLNWRFGL